MQNTISFLSLMLIYTVNKRWLTSIDNLIEWSLHDKWPIFIYKLVNFATQCFNHFHLKVLGKHGQDHSSILWNKNITRECMCFYVCMKVNWRIDSALITIPIKVSTTKTRNFILLTVLFFFFHSGKKIDYSPVVCLFHSYFWLHLQSSSVNSLMIENEKLCKLWTIKENWTIT